MSDDLCPVCGEPYAKKVNLDSRYNKTIDVSEFDKLHQTREKRPGGPTMKPTRSKSEPYTYVGYLH